MVSRKIESRTPFKILGMPGRLSINIRTTTSKAFSFGLYGTWGCSQGYRRLYSHLCRGPHIPTNNWGLESQGYTNFVHLSCTKCQEKSGHIPHDVLMKFLGTPLSPRRCPFWRLKSIVFLSGMGATLSTCGTPDQSMALSIKKWVRCHGKIA